MEEGEEGPSRSLLRSAFACRFLFNFRWAAVEEGGDEEEKGANRFRLRSLSGAGPAAALLVHVSTSPSPLTLVAFLWRRSSDRMKNERANARSAFLL